MIQSHVVDIDGSFVGTAVRVHEGYRFVALDPCLDELDGTICESLPALHREVRLRARTARGQMQWPTVSGG